MKKIPIVLVVCSVLFPLLFVLFSTEQTKEAISQLKQPAVETKEEVVVIPKKVNQPSKKPEQLERLEKPSHKQKKQKVMQRKPIIILDPGHQKNADLTKENISPKSDKQRAKQLPSAIGINTKKKESIVTLQFAKRLQKELEKKGYEVVLTRTKQDVQLSNKERALVANEKQATYVMTLHADASESTRRGFYVATPAKQAVTLKKYKESEKLAVGVLRAVSKEDRVFEKGIFYRNENTVFNWSTAPSISIQLGFLSNVKDDKKMSNAIYLNELAKWIAKGVPKAK
ncbi:N-acetylmuramoyl-L-alanine amidase family protein [Kurthia senegalensis]|uniref:N-acetylmuramoyl-L-alanine amidase family protein n=1 Tax=Kurthia senegalensis TaxID=1033740 RepID=UPI000289145B|nr:N-acetylmuramoyl-L-alanine amidase [Kurthia senegalensis]